MSQDKQEYYKNEIVHSLADAIKRGGRSLQSVPGLLAKLIREDLWVERDVNGNAISYDRTEFRKFVESPYPEGLSTTIETIERLCGDEPEIKDFLAAAKRGKVGRPPKAMGQTDGRGNVRDDENPAESAGYYSSGKVDYRINRLRDEAPKLHSKVLFEGMSVNEAYIKAGFAPRRVAVNMNDAQSAYNTLTNNMPDDVLHELINLLNEWSDNQ